MTPWERDLWKGLRDHGTGFYFRRQHPFAGYVLDFYCHEARLCVEVDGAGHREYRVQRDEERDLELEKRGVKTLRLTNGEVGLDLFGCLERISFECVNRCQSRDKDA